MSRFSQVILSRMSQVTIHAYPINNEEMLSRVLLSETSNWLNSNCNARDPSKCHTRRTIFSLFRQYRMTGGAADCLSQRLLSCTSRDVRVYQVGSLDLSQNAQRMYILAVAMNKNACESLSMRYLGHRKCARMFTLIRISPKWNTRGTH